MTDFAKGDKVRQIGYAEVGTVTRVHKCPELKCDRTYVTFEDEYGTHSAHATDLEPA